MQEQNLLLHFLKYFTVINLRAIYFCILSFSFADSLSGRGSKLRN